VRESQSRRNRIREREGRRERETGRKKEQDIVKKQLTKAERKVLNDVVTTKSLERWSVRSGISWR
jgi:hypothetical protein